MAEIKKCMVQGCRFSAFHLTDGHKCGYCGKYGHGQCECSKPTKIKKLQEKSKNIFIDEDKQCKVIGCKYKNNHTTESHNCKKCSKVYSSCYCGNCPTILVKVKCPICRKVNKIVEDVLIFGIEQKCTICMSNEINICLPECKHACLCTPCFNTIKEEDDEEDYYSDEESDIKRKYAPLLENKEYVIVNVGQGCSYYVRKNKGRTETFFMHCDNWGQYGSEADDTPELYDFIFGYTQRPE